jgi:hypothetical protein
MEPIQSGLGRQIAARYLVSDSPAVQTHIVMVQNVIGRLAGSSASCKTWCVSLVSALFVFVGGANRSDLVSIAFLPVAAFGVLDGYYLGLERGFRTEFDRFIRKLYLGTAVIDDVFNLGKGPSIFQVLWSTLRGILSFSVWPVYAGIALALWLLAERLLIPVVGP